MVQWKWRAHSLSMAPWPPRNFPLFPLGVASTFGTKVAHFVACLPRAITDRRFCDEHEAVVGLRSDRDPRSGIALCASEAPHARVFDNRPVALEEGQALVGGRWRRWVDGQ